MLPFVKFVLKAKAQEQIFLPEFKGSTFRGAFGITLRRISCFQRQAECKTCLLRNKCAYSIVFEGNCEIEKENFFNLKSIEERPRPFVIEPPLTEEKVFNEKERFNFSIILFGNSIQYSIHILYALIQLGQSGIGKNRGKFIVENISTEDGKIVYKAGENKINFEKVKVKRNVRYKFPDKKYLKLKFLTPTRIKKAGHLTEKLEFSLFIKNLLRKISILTYLYTDKTNKKNFKNLILKAKKVKIVKSDLQWLDWERYSTRQKEKMKLGGFVGEILYKGTFKEFIPYILLGQYTHIGKNCTFGLGKYEVVNEKG